MKVTETALPGVLLIEPRVFRDDRGYFMETYNAVRYAQHGVPTAFVQDNFSQSVRGTLRGLHYQDPRPQGKLVQCLRGSVFDVVVDIRRGSPTFGKWVGYELSDENAHQMWVPPGFAHGFYVKSESAFFSYKVTDYWVKEAEFSLAWNDPEIGIEWPLSGPPLLSPKDAAAPGLSQLR